MNIDPATDREVEAFKRGAVRILKQAGLAPEAAALVLDTYMRKTAEELGFDVSNELDKVGYYKQKIAAALGR